MPFAYRVTCSGRRVRAVLPTDSGWAIGPVTRRATPTRGSRVACALTRRGRLTDRAVSPIARWASIHPRPESQKYGLRPTPCRLANRSHASHQRSASSRSIARSRVMLRIAASRAASVVSPICRVLTFRSGHQLVGTPNEAERTGQGVKVRRCDASRDRRNDARYGSLGQRLKVRCT